MQHQPVKQQIQCLIHQIGVEQPPEKPFRIEPANQPEQNTNAGMWKE